jgi:hypothetical protein
MHNGSQIFFFSSTATELQTNISFPIHCFTLIKKQGEGIFWYCWIVILDLVFAYANHWNWEYNNDWQYLLSGKNGSACLKLDD